MFYKALDSYCLIGYNIDERKTFMSRFYGKIQGNRGEKTAMGSESSGFSCHIAGWDSGVAIDAEASGNTDRFRIVLTGGSNDPSDKQIIAVVENGKVVSK